MKAAAGLSASGAGVGAWASVRRSPFVVVLAGIDGSEIVNAALADTALTEVAIPRFEPACTAPCDALLWRLETSAGESLNQPGLLAGQWHRPPYAFTVRLVQYQPGSIVAEILDEGTLGTRGPYPAFCAAVNRIAMRFVRDAALGRGRGPAGTMPAAPAGGMPGWVDASLAKWRDRLMVEWWSIGSAAAPIDRVLSGGGLGDITWYRTKAGSRYLADPFPWPGTGQVLCEEMPLTGGIGRIVSVTESNGTLGPPSVLLDDGWHHSYPCTFRDGETVYCVPESTQRGATRIHRLDDDGRLVAICDVAPHTRLADPTLFRWNGRYWLGCTDLDLGGHDNFCLLHAAAITGPWTPHARWPVRIDIRGARAAGMVFNVDGRLFRPGQDCAATYGAAVVVHEILTLTESAFCERPVVELRPDKSGPFPDGLHTLVHDGERFWVDGKRFVLDLSVFGKKLSRRASGMFAGAREL
ncbi:MAG TPA: hypothetical protein VGM32_00790 [Rhodopila sp.]|jgi:hypothetical protein